MIRDETRPRVNEWEKEDEVMDWQEKERKGKKKKPSVSTPEQ